MAAKVTKRRSPGEGGCWPYQTKAGERFRVKGIVRQADGTDKEVNKRGFLTKKAGLEWLADASSVQFTRQTTGLAGSLKKIAGLPTGSALQDTASERQVNHMLFGEGKRSFSALWATHPPLNRLR